MTKAVIFDLDGTLLDTLEDLYLSVNAALAFCGFPQKSRDFVRQSVGNGVRRLMRLSVPDGEENPRFEECFHRFQSHYAAHLNDHTAPYAGVMEMLRHLSEIKCPMAIVSNKSDGAVQVLNRNLFGSLIQAAIGETDHIRRKPAPDTVLEAMHRLNVRPEDCVYVGDSEVDIQTAKNSGLPCILVSWGFRDREALAALHDGPIVDTTEELLAVLEQYGIK